MEFFLELVQVPLKLLDLVIVISLQCALASIEGVCELYLLSELEDLCLLEPKPFLCLSAKPGDLLLKLTLLVLQPLNLIIDILPINYPPD